MKYILYHVVCFSYFMLSVLVRAIIISTLIVWASPSQKSAPSAHAPKIWKAEVSTAAAKLLVIKYLVFCLAGVSNKGIANNYISTACRSRGKARMKRMRREMMENEVT